MTTLEKGIQNLAVAVDDPTLDEEQRRLLAAQLQSMRSEQALRELSPQPFYKDEF